jgi:hypothetical protein
MYGNAMTTAGAGGFAAAALPFTGGHPIAMLIGAAGLLFAALAMRALTPNRHSNDNL